MVDSIDDIVSLEFVDIGNSKTKVVFTVKIPNSEVRNNLGAIQDSDIYGSKSNISFRLEGTLFYKFAAFVFCAARQNAVLRRYVDVIYLIYTIGGVVWDPTGPLLRFLGALE